MNAPDEVTAHLTEHLRWLYAEMEQAARVGATADAIGAWRIHIALALKKAGVQT